MANENGSSTAGQQIEPETTSNVLEFLRKHGFKEAEKALLKEVSRIPDGESGMNSADIEKGDESDIGNALDSSAEENQTNSVSLEKRSEECKAAVAAYEALFLLVSDSEKAHKAELSALLFPVFAHVYLVSLSARQMDTARNFMKQYGFEQESRWRQDVKFLSHLTSLEQLNYHKELQQFRRDRYLVRLSKPCLNRLKPLLLSNAKLQSVMQAAVKIEAVSAEDGGRPALPCWASEAVAARKALEQHRVLHGLLKEDLSDGRDLLQPMSKKKRAKVEKERRRVDPNAPPFDRLPLPNWSDGFREELLSAASQQTKTAGGGARSAPSVCLVTLLNAASTGGGLNSCDVSEDSTLVAGGFGDARVQLHCLVEPVATTLRGLRADYDSLDVDDETPREIAFERADEAPHRLELRGHSGPVFGVSISTDRRLLLSASADSTVRLWSVELRSNLVVYRTAGTYPVWDVKFCPRGYYFATGGADNTACLWSTDKLQPVRLLADHLSDVNCVEFHPNCNYLATGSLDKTVRLFDLLNGQVARYFAGHQGAIQCVKVSADGRLLASCDDGGETCLFDIGQGRLLARLPAARAVGGPPATALAFSRDSCQLVVGDMAGRLRFVNIETALQAAGDFAEANSSKLETSNFLTKRTPILGLHYTRSNLSLAVGAFRQ